MFQKIKQQLKNILRAISYHYKRNKYGFIAPNASLSPKSYVYCKRNLFMYENTNINSDAVIMNTRAKFIIKQNSGAAIGLLAITGNHLSIPGILFKNITDDVKEQKDQNHELDKDIVVEEDVWIGSRVTLLSGVHLGRGCEVGSGSVVRKNVPPYACVVGNPAKIVGFKFTPEEIVEHEQALYPPDERLPKDLLDKNYDKYYLRRIKEIKYYLH